MGEIFQPGNHWSEAARAVKLKAPGAYSFSGVQVGVPLSSKCPHVRSKQLSFQLLFAHSSPNNNLNSTQSTRYILRGIYLQN